MPKRYDETCNVLARSGIKYHRDGQEPENTSVRRLSMNASTSPRFVKHVLAGLAIVCVSLSSQAGGPVHPGPTANTVIVDYSDLDLTDAGGIKTLYARLQYAAERACGGEPTVREMWAKQIYRQCFERALNDAVLNIDDATLRALHDNANRRSTVG
jgi:UrcA family protein